MKIFEFSLCEKSKKIELDVALGKPQKKFFS